MEFGVRWGQDLTLFESFRGMYEPYNNSRKIIGFDTFEGFPNVHEKDGDGQFVAEGMLTVSKKYEDYLEKIMLYHEKESPIGHLKKFELVKGDANKTIENYFEKHPETMVAFAYFDMDIYSPTKNGLEVLKKHLTKGSIIGFDELNSEQFPGETVALKEVFDISKYRIIRTPINSFPSFLIYE